MYESLVLRDGLRNAPAVFQHFLNEVFKEVLGRGVTIYIDDILIYAENLDELRRLTTKVFDLVRDASLYLKASKCEFTDFSYVLGIRYFAERYRDQPRKGQSRTGIPSTREPPRISIIYWTRQLLSPLCAELLKDRRTYHEPYQERSSLRLGRSSRTSLRESEVNGCFSTSSSPLRS